MTTEQLKFHTKIAILIVRFHMMIDLHLFRVMSSLAKETDIKSPVDNAKSSVVAYPFIEYPFKLVQIARLEYVPYCSNCIDTQR